MSLNSPVPSRNTVVLTSDENFVWHSMQEILPMLERAWLGSARPGRHEVRVFDIGRRKIQEYLPDLLKADQVVLTCFTHKLARIAAMLRREFRLDARYFIHLHNQATIACWPYHVWGLGEVLREDDVFISSCREDAATLGLAFENARVIRVPFTLPDAGSFDGTGAGKPRSATAPASFAYVGRISSQKNLHTLLLSFALLIKERPDFSGQLRIYGGEDHLGSPNMGIRETGYLDLLRKLATDLGIPGRVRFMGHLYRDRLHRELDGSRDVLVSASLHSDENFGMALFRGLCAGHAAAMTRWGGHCDLERAFAGQVRTVRVHGGGRGPWVHPVGLARAMGEAADLAEARTFSRGIPGDFSPAAIETAFGRLAEEDWTRSDAPLRPTPLALGILERRDRFFRAGDPCRIFESYSDPDAAALFRSYGMADAPIETGHGSGWTLVPWARIEGDSCLISDPHRGEWTLPWSGDAARAGELIRQGILYDRHPDAGTAPAGEIPDGS